ncbi:MAG: hypothetical protein ACK526_23545 [Planctomyces sp.]|jgi:hypothetical protein
MRTVLVFSLCLIGFLNPLQAQESWDSEGDTSGFDGENPTFSAPNHYEPNSSGNQNQGGFQDDGFFRPGNNSYPGSISTPGNFQYPGYNQYNGQIQPYNSYPNNSQYINGSQYQMDAYGNWGLRGGTPTGNVISQPVASGLPIQISCNDQSGATLPYQLITGSGNSYPYEIMGGQKQNFKETQQWEISYAPSPGAQTVQYRLRGGKRYEFRSLNGQWQLFTAR